MRWLVMLVAACGRIGFAPTGSGGTGDGNGPSDGARPDGVVSLTCGDDVVDVPLEDCDDGAVVEGDGCSSQCFFEDQGPGGPCSSPTLLRMVRISSTSRGGFATGDLTTGVNGTNTTCGGTNSPELAFQVGLLQAGLLKWTLSAITPTTLDPALTIWTNVMCGNQTNEVLCDNAGGVGVTESGGMQLPAGLSAIIAVQTGTAGALGSFNLTVTISP